jgi:hypothetical protein
MKNKIQTKILIYLCFCVPVVMLADKTYLKTISAQLKCKTYSIKGKVTQTFSYCGGAAPSKEMIDNLAKPVAYPGKKFFVRRGKINSTENKIVKSFISDSIGEFSIDLPAGTYSIIQEEQVNEIKASHLIKENLEVDSACLQKWWSEPYYILEVNGKNKEPLNFNFHHRCFISSDIPCISYHGPMPP